MSKPANPVGRPPGEVTPQKLLRGEMSKSAKTMDRIRTMIEQQIAEIEGQLATAPLDTRLAVLTGLGTLVQQLSRSMDLGAKYLMADKGNKLDEGHDPQTHNADDVYKQLESKLFKGK
jgi:hypothetical protein